MDDWLTEERNKLLRLGVRAFIKAGAVTLVVVGALLAGVFVALDELDLDPAMANVALMVAAVALPVIAFFMMDWLRQRFWVRAIGGHARRLRAVQFLSNYADAVGEDRLDQLPTGAREQVKKVLEKERQGMLPPERDYALALQPMMAFQPSRSAPRGPRRKGPRDASRHQEPSSWHRE